ncbi:DUF4238 domain-containing protein [Pseudomonas lurida]|uniref:DUF4238 domain-containing protein n=1 Tax=Pseudomonas lurida TaxID=244566 RepID=UPI003D267A6D
MCNEKRRQHYVWRHYLRPWSNKDQIWCHRDGKTFLSNLMGVAQKRDFYKVSELTEEDIIFINKTAIEFTKNEMLRESNKGWIDTFQMLFTIRNQLSASGIEHPGADAIFDELAINMEEDLHSAIEAGAIKHIEKILELDTSLFSSEEEYMSFSHFICVQYLRTNRIKENAINNTEGLYPGVLERTFGVLRHIYATNMAWSTFARREEFRPVLLVNNTETNFIAGDQPIINTYAANVGWSVQVEEVEFYYPFSPKVAVIISSKEQYGNGYIFEQNAEQVHMFNTAIARSAHSQIYAQSRSDLVPYIDEMSFHEQT